jgi:hypothetical protein
VHVPILSAGNGFESFGRLEKNQGEKGTFYQRPACEKKYDSGGLAVTLP